MPANNYSAGTDVGLLRDNNEDAILSDPDQGLWVVADGMGGHEAGEIASQITIETIREAIGSGESLEQAIKTAHRAILKEALHGSGKPGMGSTVVALKNHGSRYQIGWVGDSRAYLWSRSQGAYRLQQLSTDHSYVQMLYQSGVISAEELLSHPDKNIITQCLGSTELEQVQVDSLERKWYPGDWLLLCSDGLNDTVTDQSICDILNHAADLDQAVQALIQAALRNGGKDNVSVVAVEAPSSLGMSLRSTLGRWSRRFKPNSETE